MANNGQPYVTPDLVRVHVHLSTIRQKSTLMLVLGLVMILLSSGMMAMSLAIGSATHTSYLVALVGALLMTVGLVSQAVLCRQIITKFPYIQKATLRIILLCMTPPALGILTWLGLLATVTTRYTPNWFVLFVLPLLIISHGAVCLQAAWGVSGLVRRHGEAALMPLWHLQHQQIEQQMQFLGQFQARQQLQDGQPAQYAPRPQ